LIELIAEIEAAVELPEDLQDRVDEFLSCTEQDEED